MVAASYELKIDTLRNATYGASIDDISSRVLSLDWNEGMQDSYQQFAPPARLKVNLNNIDGAFNSDTIGAEVLTNADFATWSGDNPSSWTVTGEVATDPEISQVSQAELHNGVGSGSCNIYSTSAAVSISQTVLTVGTSYKVELAITASAESAGWIGVYSGTTLVSPRYHLTGHYIFYFNADSTTFKIQGEGAVDMTVYGVSVKPTATYGYLLTKGTLARLRVTYNAVTYTKFIGRLDRKSILPGSIGRRIAVLEFIDPMFELLDTEYQPELQEDVTVDTAIAKIFDNAIAPFPYSRSYWMLGIQGASELELTTTIYSPPSYSLETGITVLDYVGDNQHVDGKGINAQTFIRNMVDAEIDGRFWFDASTGKFIFHNRHHDVKHTASDGAITDGQWESDMSSFLDSEEVVNYASLSFKPRKIGSASSVIWNSDNLPLTLSPQQVYKTTARYRDATLKNARIGAKDWVIPVPGTDYAVVDGNGADKTDMVTVVVKFNANSADIVITSNTLHVLIVNTLQLRGTPIQTFDSREVTARNGDSEYITKYMPERYSIPALSNEEFAQQVVQYKINKFSTPITRFQSLGFLANKSDALMINALAFDIENRIDVTDTWTEHDADYIIVGARHSVVMGGDHSHETTFILKPQSLEVFWTLGVFSYSELGQTTRLAL